jgi:spore photoproduct lyase
MNPFLPARVFYESDALKYPLGNKLVSEFQKLGIPVAPTGSHNRVSGIPGKTTTQAYREGKRTLVIGVRKGKTFQSCKPSAHFQLPLVTSCPGMCEYCYLNTTLGKKPYIRVYVNLEEILQITKELIIERQPEITIFEGAATSDPLPVEDYTGALKQAIQFFGKQQNGRFRFVTKFTNVDSLLNIEHQGHTRFRFSLNCAKVVKEYEHATPPPEERIKAAGKVLKAGYPLGFIIAPIIRFDNWQKEYEELIISLARELEKNSTASKPEDLTFEWITHRFTTRARNNILEVFPSTTLPMNEEERKYKYGQFGYGKYIYNREEMEEMKEFFYSLMERYIPGARSEYFI